MQKNVIFSNLHEKNHMNKFKPKIVRVEYYYSLKKTNSKENKPSARL